MWLNECIYGFDVGSKLFFTLLILLRKTLSKNPNVNTISKYMAQSHELVDINCMHGLYPLHLFSWFMSAYSVDTN